MVITDIIPVAKQKYKITTDEQLTFVLYKGELSHYQLDVGVDISENVWEEIYLLLEKRAKLRAMHLLTKMDYTESELYQKLVLGGYTESAVECAIQYVKSYHYLDDKRYVKKYMEQPNNKSHRQKEFELEKKGISKDLIRQWSKERDEEQDSNDVIGITDETVLIRNLLEKRCKNPMEADDKEKMKHYAYLARKGFLSSDIMQVFESYFCCD